MMKKLLIFDLDGLLVDTEHTFYKAFKSAGKRYGKVPNYNTYVREVVSSGQKITDLMDLTEESAINLREEVYKKYGRLIHDVKLKPGAKECLEHFYIKYDCVLVTGSKKCFADFFTEKFSLKKYFKDVITRDDPFPLKPDPAVFKHLLEKYNMVPWECLVIEDSRRGITAAQALGIPCIYIPTDNAQSEELGTRVKRINSLAELTEEVIQETLDTRLPKTDHTLVNLYRDGIARLTDTFLIYKDIYSLSEYRHEDSEVVSDAFDYARKRGFFIILILSTRDGGRVYFQRSFDSGHLTMTPLGGALHLEKDDTLFNAINRIASKTLKGARIADVAPLVCLVNVFKSNKGETVEHIGLGIRALLLNSTTEIENYEKDVSVKGAFVRDFPFEEILQPPARITYNSYLKWSKAKDYSTYVGEIEAQHDVMWRYHLHQSLINPVIMFASKFIGMYSISEVKAKILDAIGLVSSCVDVACGDDRGVFRLLEKIPLVVANDICVDQIASLENEYQRTHLNYPKAHTILFTNHDCLDLPYRQNAFQVSICRNLLHHMQTAKDLAALLSNIRRVARRILIIEIEDPSRGKLWERLRHKYYLDWLKDEGKHLYVRDDFERVVHQHFGQDTISFDYWPTIRGTYMVAKIDKS